MSVTIQQVEYIKKAKIESISTIKTKGYIKGVFYPKNQKELIVTYTYLTKNKLPHILIGNGSNLLFSKKSKKIIGISTKRMKKRIFTKKNILYANAPTTLTQCFKICLENNLSGFEELATIPGTIGGAIKVNAGCFNKNIFSIIEEIKIFKNGKIETITKNNINYEYRKTNLKNCLILSAKFKLQYSNKKLILDKYKECLLIRSQKQPQGFSAGSVFKNPIDYGLSAGYLIESCNLKGYKYKKAQISNKHANFIINNGNATFKQVQHLIKLCKKRVKKIFNIDLECEIEIV